MHFKSYPPPPASQPLAFSSPPTKAGDGERTKAAADLSRSRCKHYTFARYLLTAMLPTQRPRSPPLRGRSRSSRHVLLSQPQISREDDSLPPAARRRSSGRSAKRPNTGEWGALSEHRLAGPASLVWSCWRSWNKPFRSPGAGGRGAHQVARARSAEKLLAPEEIQGSMMQTHFKLARPAAPSWLPLRSADHCPETFAEIPGLEGLGGAGN